MVITLEHKETIDIEMDAEVKEHVICDTFIVDTDENKAISSIISSKGKGISNVISDKSQDVINIAPIKEEDVSFVTIEVESIEKDIE